MPTLFELLEAEGPYVVGALDGKQYCKMSIIVELHPEVYDVVDPVCLADDWHKHPIARLIETQKQIDELTRALTTSQQRASAFEHDFTIALKQANRATWLESEVSRLTAELAPYKEAEAARRMGQTAQDAFQGMNDAMANAWFGSLYSESPVRTTIAPIFKKLCQCEACLELRAYSGYPIAEIEGH